MCGIAGEIALEKNSQVSLERAWPMINAILHRGPDGVGDWEESSQRVALLHSRLAIVDITGGQQPMHGSAGDVTIVFNGEIYGFEHLREELEKGGYYFRTTSDTEVLIALYLRDGSGFVDHLEGEFAFVLYDGSNQKTLIARDRFGVKPLFYSIQNGLLLFGSEIKSLLAHPMTERRFEPEAVFRRIHGVFLPDETLFAGINPVMPGTMMTIDAKGQITSRQHAELNPEVAGTWRGSRAQAEDAFEEAFKSAVKDRLHGDVDIGLYLSGGVDSILTGAMMRENSTKDHSAYTIGFDEAAYAEAEDAGFAASKLGFTHKIEGVGNGDLDGHFARSMWHSESIAVNTHGTAKLCLSGRASKDVKVILAGEGADEIHGGYAYFRHAELLSTVENKSSRKALKEFLKSNSSKDGIMPTASFSGRKRLAGNAGLGIPYSAQRANIVESLLYGLVCPELRNASQTNTAGQLIDWIDHFNPVARRLDDMTLSRYTIAITDMPNYNLSFLGDRSEMANGIEGRLPYLDKRVVDLLWQLPSSYHVNGDQTKTLIRSALAKRMPSRVSNRYKRLFVAPGSAGQGLFCGDMARQYLSKEATEKAGVFRPTAVSALRQLYLMLPEQMKFRHALESFLMTAISINLLYDLFIENFDSSLKTFCSTTGNVQVQKDFALSRKIRASVVQH